MKLIHIIGRGMATLGLVAMTTIPASASTNIELTNYLTGPGSVNRNRVVLRNNLNVGGLRDEACRLYRMGVISGTTLRHWADRYGWDLGDFDFDLNRTVDINNDIRIDANTGGNVIEGNTLVGDVRTGDIGVDVHVMNEGL